MRTGRAWGSSGHTRASFGGMAPASTVIQTAWCAAAIWRKNQQHNVTPKHDRNGPPRGVGHYHILRAGDVLEEVVAIVHPRIQQAQRDEQDTENDTNNKPDDVPGHGPAIQIRLRTLIWDVGPHVAEQTASGALLRAHRFPHRLGLGLPLTRVPRRIAPLWIPRGLVGCAGCWTPICRLPIAARSSGLTPALRRRTDLGVVLPPLLGATEDVVCRVDPFHHESGTRIAGVQVRVVLPHQDPILRADLLLGRRRAHTQNTVQVLVRRHCHYPPRRPGVRPLPPDSVPVPPSPCRPWPRPRADCHCTSEPVRTPPWPRCAQTPGPARQD